MIRSAIFDKIGKYRYLLIRQEEDYSPDDGYVNFIMLNPSTADHKIDDPTIRRCMGFAKEWGYKSTLITNLFAFRTPHPKELKSEEFPIGEENWTWIDAVAHSALLVICAWGAHGEYQNRGLEITRKLVYVNLYYLELTVGGQPMHPLYLKKGLEPLHWKKPYE